MKRKLLKKEISVMMGLVFMATILSHPIQGSMIPIMSPSPESNNSNQMKKEFKKHDLPHSDFEKTNKVNHSLKIPGLIMGVLMLTTVTGGIALFAPTDADYTVPATVVDDASLPSMKINGVQLHLETYGEPDQPVIIVLHGGPGADYRSLLGLKELADQYHVVFYDQRGAGLSERLSADELTIQDYLEELDAIVDHFGQGKPVYIIGHSWGAALASGYLGYAPQKVEKAVLAEPGYLNMEEMQEWLDNESRYTKTLRYFLVSFITGFRAQRIDGPDEYARNDYIYSKMITYFLNLPNNPYHCPGESYDAPHWRIGSIASDAIREESPEEINRLEKGAEVFQKPVLFLAGECDTWIGPDLQAKHVDLYTNAMLEVIPDAGHDMFWDNPQVTMNVIRDFLV